MIFDITQEHFSSHVYPGDPAPHFTRLSQIGDGAVCNCTFLEMHAHNGTHVDAPRHFLDDGATVEALDPAIFVGPCRVVTPGRDLDAAGVATLALDGVTRLLLRGATVLPGAAAALARRGIVLVGVEDQSVAAADVTAQVHIELLSVPIIPLEGLTLDGVPDGDYLLSACPLKLGESDGAPCRALLITAD